MRQPLRRTPSGFKEIGWREAFDLAADGLARVRREHGRDAVAVYLGNPITHNLGAMVSLVPLLAALRTRSRFSATSVDQLPRMLVSLLLYGHQLLIPIPDIDNTDFFLIIGANPVASNGSIMTAPGIPRRIRAIQERGGRVVVVDPRRTETAAIASEHHFIRPGTDALLLRLRVATAHPRASVNDLTDEALVDGLAGTASFSGVPVSVDRGAEADRAIQMD